MTSRIELKSITSPYRGAVKAEYAVTVHRPQISFTASLKISADGPVVFAEVTELKITRDTPRRAMRDLGEWLIEVGKAIRDAKPAGAHIPVY